MPYLRLTDLRTNTQLEFEREEVRIGRLPDLELVVEGEGANVVSGNHARLAHEGTNWLLEDLGSRNGTFLGNKRLVPGGREPVFKGTEIRFGANGPRFVVDAVAKRVIAETVAEGPRAAHPSAATMPMSALGDATQPMEGLPPAPPPPRPQAQRSAPSPPPPPPPPALQLVVTDARSGDRFEASGECIRIGRGTDCELRPVAAGDTSVSRVHAEIELDADRRVVIKDTGSRNGTILNGRILTSAHELKTGDRVQLGEAGPELVVERLLAGGKLVEGAQRPAKDSAKPKKPKPAEPNVEAGAGPIPRRSYGGKGKTVFFREMFEETERKTTKKVRWIVWSFVGLLVLLTGGMYAYSEWRTRQTVAELQAQQDEVLSAQRAIADSMRQAARQDLERVRQDLDSARASSAPASVVESLRVALEEANRRTTGLENALKRSQTELRRQLAAGDSAQRAAQSNVQRLQQQLLDAQTGGTSGQLLDSLRRAIADAEQKQQEIDSRLRAVRGAGGLAAISQGNQAAVGLVTAYFGQEISDASGFVITTSGYYVTNHHAVAERDGTRADSVFVTMADQSLQRRADVISVASGGNPDLALLKIRDYSGPYIQKLDWAGASVRQGEAAALIGFPEGMALALDETRTVRTSMSAGIFSKVTSEGVQFDGFTVGGSSGSPIFNANGEVVAVHRAGLRAGPGLSLAIPLRRLVPLLPPEVKAEARVP